MESVENSARVTLVVIRVSMAAIILTALVAQLVFTWRIYAGVPRYLIKYFSFFTVQSNLMASGSLLLGVWYALRRSQGPFQFAVFRCGVAVYMIVTSVVYHMPFNVITLDQPVTVTWANTVLHLVAPAYLLVDFLLAPGRTHVRWNRFWIIMTYPVGWLIYTMVRAPLVDWYPYPFLNPRFSQEGNLSVAGYLVVIALFIAAVTLIMIGLSRLPLPWRTESRAPAVGRPDVRFGS
ncbi:Pr6Pr family membrane protein [Parafrigoribacterium mesophilum]|uniref:Pr6Pr family membrane protein n=1 Tax=Parafrigoribacterium mesophilum TaxID=433646 RepID=UPI0031FCC97E